MEQPGILLESGMWALACPCGSLRVYALKPKVGDTEGTAYQCPECGRHALPSRDRVNRLELWNRYAERAWWRPRAIAHRQGKQSA